MEGYIGICIYSKSIEIFKSTRLPDHCSVFQAEVSAIQAVVIIIVNKNVHERRVTLLSVRKAAFKALDSSVINSKTVYECRRCLNEITNRYEVRITWVSGYRNIAGNIAPSDEFSTLGIPLNICRAIIYNAFVPCEIWMLNSLVALVIDAGLRLLKVTTISRIYCILPSRQYIVEVRPNKLCLLNKKEKLFFTPKY